MEATNEPSQTPNFVNLPLSPTQPPIDWRYYQHLDSILGKRQYDEVLTAIEAHRDAIIQSPVPIFLIEARVYSERGDVRKAIEVLLPNAGTGKSDYWAHFNLAACYRALHDIEGTFRHYRAAHAAIGWQESEKNKYIITHDYFSPRIPKWKAWFEEYITKSPIACLEIGSWQGGSASWLLDKIVSNRGGSLTCIDTFEGSSEHQTFIDTLGHPIDYFFDTNVQLTGHGALCQKIKGLSQQVLPTLFGRKFDFIYIDGAHEAKYVIQDAVLSWILLPVGGFMLFDDVDFRFPNAPDQDTARAIDFFAAEFAAEIEVVERSPQLLLRRIAGFIANPAGSSGKVATNRNLPSINPRDDGQTVRRQLDRLRSVLAGVGPEICLQSIYGHLGSTVHAGADARGAEAALEELRNCFAALAAVAPRHSQECVTLAVDLGLTDIERVFLAAAALSRMPHETFWTHYLLLESLNRLLLAGVTAARVPCVLHSLLSLMNPGTDCAHGGLPHAIIAREMRMVAPRDAVRNGVEALKYGVPTAYHDLIAAAATLGVAEDQPSPRPDINQLKAIIEKCGFQSLLNIPDTVQIRYAASVSQEMIIDKDARTVPAPRGDRTHYVFRDADRRIELPPISVYEIEGGTISFDVSHRGRTEYYVFDGSDRCVTDLSWGVNPFIVDDRQRVEGSLAVLDDRFAGAMNICHFLLDNLTRIAIYQRYTGRKFACLVSGNYAYYREVLNLAGLAGGVLYPQLQRFSVRANSLLVSSNVLTDFRHPAHLCASWALDFLRQQFLSKPSPPNRRKIYIRRTDVAIRNILNADQVEEMMSRHGFEPVVLGHMSAASQIELFQAVSHVVGVHGAGLTNVLFSDPGTRVLEILPPLTATNAYWVLCSQMKHKYTAVVADDPEYPRPDYDNWPHRAEFGTRNVIMPLDRLAQALDLMDGDR